MEKWPFFLVAGFGSAPKSLGYGPNILLLYQPATIRYNKHIFIITKGLLDSKFLVTEIRQALC